MRRRAIPIMLVCLAMAAVALPAQQTQSQSLPQYTTEQRWTRAAFLLDAWIAFSIHDARAHSRTLDDLTKALVDFYAPGWGANNTPALLLRGVRRNFLFHPGAEVEVLQASDTLAQMRVNRAWLASFDSTGHYSDVSVEDYEQVVGGFQRGVADRLGMVYEQTRQGDQMLVTIRRKK